MRTIGTVAAGLYLTAAPFFSNHQPIGPISPLESVAMAAPQNASDKPSLPEPKTANLKGPNDSPEKIWMSGGQIWYQDKRTYTLHIQDGETGKEWTRQIVGTIAELEVRTVDGTPHVFVWYDQKDGNSNKKIVRSGAHFHWNGNDYYSSSTSEEVERKK